MVNAPSADNQSITREEASQPGGGPQDSRLPENPADLSTAATSGDLSEQETAESLLDQVREALHDMADTASGKARDAYGQGQRYARRAGERYPETGRYYREGRQAVTRRVAENPLLSLILAGAVGYMLAWMIHGERRDRNRRVPDYGRTERGYLPYRDNRRGQ